jgi:hypothetical protein
MAIQYPNFHSDPNDVPQTNGIPGVIDAVQKGYLLAKLPAKMKQESALAAAKLDSEKSLADYRKAQAAAYPELYQSLVAQRQAQTDLQRQQAAGLPDKQAADLAVAQAHANLYNAQTQNANNPMTKLTGDAGNAYNLERLRQQAIKDPSLQPYYDEAKKAYDLTQNSQKTLNNYRENLNESIGKRYATPLGKLYDEAAEVQEGFRPGTNRTEKLTPEEQEDLTDKYKLDINKKTTDAALRKRAIFGAQLDKTLSLINPKILTSYSGVSGQAKYNADKLKSAMGNPSPEFLAYQQEITKATQAAKQLRQYLGDTVKTEGQNELKALVDPSTWYNNPEVALAKYNTFVDTFHNEQDISTEALQGPSIYERTAGKNTATEKPKLTPEQAAEMAKQRRFKERGLI